LHQRDAVVALGGEAFEFKFSEHKKLSVSIKGDGSGNQDQRLIDSQHVSLNGMQSAQPKKHSSVIV
jgi:hypothetical protein